MRIRTKYQTNAKGTGQIVAVSSGQPEWFDGVLNKRQLTVPFDPAQSSDYNHGAAAGLLLRKFAASWVSPATFTEIEAECRFLAGQPITHDSSEDGVTHTFTL